MSLKLLDRKKELLRRIRKCDSFVYGSVVDARGVDKILQHIEKHSFNMDLVIWRDDLLSTAADNSDLLIGEPFKRDWMPSNDQWWVPETYKSPSWRKIQKETSFDAFAETSTAWSDPPGASQKLEAIMIVTNDPGPRFSDAVIAVFVHTDANDEISLGVSFFAVGHKMECDDGVKKYHSMLMCPAAGLEFMSQEFVSLRKNHAGKKSAKIPGGSSQQSFFDVVLIRRKPITHTNANQGQQQQVEWSGCWTQRAHRRRLSRPRKSDGATFTWVSACVKGDTDKPMLPSKERIIKVRR